MGSDFNASQDVVIPIGTGDSTRRNFPTLLGAMAQIQQFFVIEKSGQEIPDEFLTIQGKFNFFKVGCGSGFIEGLTFALLAAFVVPILSDQKLMMSVAHYFPLAQSKVFLHTLNCFPVLLTCGLCCFLSRYRIGTLTRKAVDAFLFGRLMSLVMKGIIIFRGLTWLSGAITESSAWSAAKWVSLKQYGPAREIYRIILNTKPYLDYMATETIVIFTAAIIVPFITVWGVSLLRNLKARRQRASWNG